MLFLETQKLFYYMIMGREWWYKASDGGDGSSRFGTKSSSTTKSTNRKTRKQKNTASSGCMNAIFKLFDIQQHRFRFHHPSFIHESAINNPKQSHFPIHGLEAPRKSLESSEFAIAASPSTAQEQAKIKIPMGAIQTKTKRPPFTENQSSECSGSPGTKTPNLVARLMGLDILPEYSSPRPSSSTPANSHHRSRSLPTTPRISTSSRPSTDNDYHHRLSLQIDKENCNSWRGSKMKITCPSSELMVNEQDNDKEPANQLRGRISRRLGTDITNTISRTTRDKEQRRDTNLVLLKTKKPLPLSSQPPPPSSMPAAKTKKYQSAPSLRLRLSDINNKPSSNSQSSPSRKEESKPPFNQRPSKKPMKDKKVRRIASERYDLQVKKRTHEQEDAFVSKICKKKSTPRLPEHVVNVKNTTKFVSVKKEMTVSVSRRTLPQKQVSFASTLPSDLNSSYNENDMLVPAVQSPSISSSAGSFSDHSDYIASILHHCGIHITTPISVGQWYSPSHPLHPSIFDQLEKLHHPTATTAKRKMIFELVDELLGEILKPYTNLKPWAFPRPPDSCSMCGSDLIRKLRESIGSIPAADCQMLEDIDGLIERDLGRSMQQVWWTAFEAEVAEIVKEIEGEILETLVHEVEMAPAWSRDQMPLVWEKKKAHT